MSELGGGSGGLVVWVRGLGRSIAFALVLILKSESVVPSSADGGGSAGGLVRGVSGSLSADLVQEEVVSMV